MGGEHPIVADLPQREGGRLRRVRTVRPLRHLQRSGRSGMPVFGQVRSEESGGLGECGLVGGVRPGGASELHRRRVHQVPRRETAGHEHLPVQRNDVAGRMQGGLCEELFVYGIFEFGHSEWREWVLAVDGRPGRHQAAFRSRARHLYQNGTFCRIGRKEPILVVDPILLAASIEGSTGKRRREAVYVGLALGIAAVLLVLGTASCYFRKRNKAIPEVPNDVCAGHNTMKGSSVQRHTEDLELPLLDLFTLSKATDNFSLNSKLGEGGFGPVYKGVLEGGQEIAVKRLSETSKQGLGEFKNEVICIAKLQHRNLVKLLGCCIEGEETMLVYEYMPNKSLDLFIFDEARSGLLDWPKRFNIINGIARGLLYLHQDSRLRIIHRDLKTSNILLDIDMNPKISDFGMAKSFGGNETGANTCRVVGTYGYMSPEYAVDGIFSVKSDVFSFGVLVLEIIGGKKNRRFIHPDHHLNLLGHAWTLYKENRSMEMVDPILVSSCDPAEVTRSIHVALLCVQQAAEDRPNMSSVVWMLGNEGVLPEAKLPGFFTQRSVAPTEQHSSWSTQTPSSVNDVTISLLDAR
ncbi:unnamed protein product [Cuscuta epithymum]|uniref:non-specific serine/threonine protein kinase n=1 Tax=Cuscuta epithymum TaxID=186058 RepID=A0AAV0FK53_9ASTE|nr:unnamed protein product [Cuscuta epithymum]